METNQVGRAIGSRLKGSIALPFSSSDSSRPLRLCGEYSGSPLIVALDVPTADEAVAITRSLAGAVGVFKVGLELFHAAGPGIFRRLREAGAERIFYDGKFCDIPNTVGRATRALAEHRLWMINVHALAGRAAMGAALEAAENGARETGAARPRVIAVTLLTSLSAGAVNDELGLPGTTEANVVRLALLAQETGLDGVVCSPLEAAAVRATCGPEFIIVTPGIRSAAAAGDQHRLSTPRAAVKAGANYLVVGREVTQAADRRAAAERLAGEAAVTGEE
jgi:orotidine-5'-phosphate decarboxylase